LCSGNGTPYTNLLIVKGHSKICLGLILLRYHCFSTDIPTQLEPSFSQWKMWVLGQEHRHMLPAKTSYKNAFFFRSHLLPVHTASVSTALYPVISCLRKTQLKTLFPPVKFRVVWDVAPCSLIGLDRCFRDAFCLHHQGDDPVMIK
jgi:hypothetical protein